MARIDSTNQACARSLFNRSLCLKLLQGEVKWDSCIWPRHRRCVHQNDLQASEMGYMSKSLRVAQADKELLKILFRSRVASG